MDNHYIFLPDDMDHEKPPGALPQYHELPAERKPLTGGAQHVEPMMVEEPSEVERGGDSRRRDSLWRVLRERHINMIAFSGTIGNGLFLGSGRSLAAGGPGGAVLAYVLMGTVIAAVLSCLGEMAALMPVNAPAMEFPRRFLDRGVGFAVGWIYWFAYCVLAADQLVAATNIVRFVYDDKITYLKWEVGRNVNPAVWVTLFLVLVTVVNMFPVIYFGELEYVFGSLKLIFIVLLIVMMLILSVIQPRENAYYQEPLGSKYWDKPYSFFAPDYHVRGDNGYHHKIDGTVGTFVGVWVAMVNVIFSYVGVDIFAATAAESKALPDSESMKMAARKISIRAVTLYAFSMLTVSFAVPRDHPFLAGVGGSVGSRSPFVIAVVEAGLPAAAQVFNAVFLFSAFTCAINSMYIASRVLHTLALRDQTGPEFITRRLRRCHAGVPLRAVLVTAMMMLLGYLGPGEEGSDDNLSELATNCTVSCLLVYATICATYLCFYRTLEETKNYATTSEAQAACYDRDHPRYPYKSHGQWLKACYGLIACVILIIFNGVPAFLAKPFDVRHFFASYIGIPVYLLLVVGYKVRRHGLRISQWGPERSKDLSNTVQVASDKRKGRLEFPEKGITANNFTELLRWVWVWMR